MREIHFVVIGDYQQAVKDITLEAARARSHAARVSRKQKVAARASQQKQAKGLVTTDAGLPVDCQLQEDEPTSVSSALTTGSYHTWRSRPETWQMCKRKSQRRLTTTAWQWITGTSIDPFSVIPGADMDTDSREWEFRKIFRQLLQLH